MAVKPDRGGEATGQSAPLRPVVEFALDSQRYALPLETVEQVLAMVLVSPLPQAPDMVVGVINFHGVLLPVLDIRSRFGLPPRTWGPQTQLMVVRPGPYRLVLPVDQVSGVSRVSVDPIPPEALIYPGVGPLAGIVRLPDGLLFLCDVEAFLSLDEARQLAAALKEMNP